MELRDTTDNPLPGYMLDECQSKASIRRRYGRILDLQRDDYGNYVKDNVY